MKLYFLKKHTTLFSCRCPAERESDEAIAAVCYDLLAGWILKGVTLSHLPCHLLEGSSHVCVVDGLIMKCI